MGALVAVHAVEPRTGSMALRTLAGGRVWRPGDAGNDDPAAGPVRAAAGAQWGDVVSAVAPATASVAASADTPAPWAWPRTGSPPPRSSSRTAPSCGSATVNTSSYAEIRQLGGALADPHPDHPALSHLPGRFLVFAAGLALDEAAAAAAERDAARVVDALRPWASGKAHLNFVERPCDASTAFTVQAWERLQRLRAAYDPHGVLQATHPVTVPTESRNSRALR